MPGLAYRRLGFSAPRQAVSGPRGAIVAIGLGSVLIGFVLLLEFAVFHIGPVAHEPPCGSQAEIGAPLSLTHEVCGSVTSVMGLRG